MKVSSFFLKNIYNIYKVKNMKNKIIIIGKILIYIYLSLAIFFIFNVVAGSVVYESLFYRYEFPDYNITPGLLSYEKIKDEYPRDEISYKSNGVKITGYYYHPNDSNMLVVFSHGINDVGDSLLPLHMYFVDKGYNVFSYDNAGCGKSEGRAQGFTQAFVDLDHTLSFLEEDNRFKDYKKLLVGFSCGAFAVGAIGNLEHKNIVGNITICGFNDSKTVIQEKGKVYVGPLAYFGIPVLNELERNKFGKYLEYSAIDGINKSNLPTLVVHSVNDPIVSTDVESIMKRKDDITNPNVTYLNIYNHGHGDVFYTDDALLYQKNIKNDLDKLSYEDKKNYCDKVDDHKYSKLNTILTNAFDELCLKMA